MTKKLRGALALTLILLLAIRIALPYGILHYVNRQFQRLPDYQAHIRDLDLHILAGSYVLKDITLDKKNSQIKTPYFKAKQVTLQLEWRALLKLAIVGQLIFDQPEINFVTDPTGKDEQLTIDQQWQQIVKSLFPLNFNKIMIRDGGVHWRSFKSDPKFDIYLKNVQAEVNNIQNANRDKQHLPSYIHAKGQTMDGAQVALHSDFDPFAQKPTFYLTTQLKAMQVAAVNQLLSYYTKVKVSSGLFSLYIEMHAENGQVNGYAKPFFKDLEIAKPQEPNPIKAVYRGLVQAITNLLTNNKTENVATKIKFSGNFDNPKTSVWSTIYYLLRNAFIQALVPNIDHDVKPETLKNPAHTK